MKEPFVHLEYDEESKEFISTIVGNGNPYKPVPMPITILSEQEKLRLGSTSKPMRKGTSNTTHPKINTLPILFQTYVGALTIVGLYMVYKYTQKN